MFAALDDLLWQLAYVGPVAGALAAGAGILLLKRRTAPRPALVAAVTFVLVLIGNAVLWLRSEWLVYDMKYGGVVPYLVLQLQLVAVTSALLHAAAVLVVTWAILADRRKPAEPVDDDNDGSATGG